MSVKHLREDITGLRAIAVLSVTIYHIFHVVFPDSEIFSGGFLGVDIFFVISGFLMTKIIIEGMDKGNFSLGSFYKRRAKRICPGLLVTVVFFIAIYLIIFSSYNINDHLRDGIRSLGFISNVWFASRTGYFDLDATERLFIHTWSLSVEWQFYLLFPLLLMILRRLLLNRKIALTLVVLTILSFVAGCLTTTANPNISYFYLHSRAFELLIGSLAYFYPLSYFVKRYRGSESYETESVILSRRVELTGLILIIVSLCFIDEKNGWPNFISVIPLFGTYLCLAADNRQTYLSHTIIQKLGIWSYSLYLVHWPVIVMFGLLPEQNILLIIITILILGITLHYTVESRRNYGIKFLVVYFAAALGMQLLNKYSYVFVPDMRQAEFPDTKQYDNDQRLVSYHTGDQNSPALLILTGDSYARQYVNALIKYFPDKNLQFVITDGCYSAKNYIYTISKEPGHPNEKCVNRFLELKNILNKYPEAPVIWAQHWSTYNRSNPYVIQDRNSGEIISTKFEDIMENDITETLTVMYNGKRKVYLFADPHKTKQAIYTKQDDLWTLCYVWKNQPNFLNTIIFRQYCKADEFLPEIPINMALQNIVKTMKTSGYSHIEYIDPSEGFCEGNRCTLLFDPDNKAYPTFSDGHHLSAYGADIVIRFLLQKIDLQSDSYK